MESSELSPTLEFWQRFRVTDVLSTREEKIFYPAEQLQTRNLLLSKKKRFLSKRERETRSLNSVLGEVLRKNSTNANHRS